METRKLQEVGGGTFTVSIPKEWARDHGFEVGMELQLYTHRDGSILVRSSEGDVNCLEEATVDVDARGTEAVARAARLAHGLGFETITLCRTTPFSDAERKAVRAAVRDLVGTNVLSESDAEITIRHLLDASSVSVCQSIVQLQYLTVSLLRDATEAFVDAADERSAIRERAGQADRSADMVTRHFSRSLVSRAELDELDVSRAELFAHYETATRLRTVAEQAVRIADAGAKATEPPAAETSGDVTAVAEGVADAVEEAVTAVLCGDMAEARRARRRYDGAVGDIEAIRESLYDESASLSTAAAVALTDALSALQRAADCGRSVTDVAARTAIRAANMSG